MARRLGHLFLYDDVDQLEVRHVLSLSLYNVDIYAGGEQVPEGELWVKRNCIRLMWRATSPEVAHDSKPFYLFSDNCSDKEDFYHALLQNQDRAAGNTTSSTPAPLAFETAHIVKLVQQLHASEENMQTRWINALVGRLFLSLYKTADLQKLIHTKITKKISRVPKPAFIESIKVKHIDLGDSAPLLTNPKLRELTIDGDMTIEGDVKYKGNLRIEIAAVARIDLGPRFKARRVDLLLAGIVKSLEGHVLIRVKPPPSNRIWFTFDPMPKIDLSIEPIVSSRQITYGIILRAIESRIREVIGDTLVLPNWDDIAFSDTSNFDVRGGIWTEQARPEEQGSLESSLLVDDEFAEPDLGDFSEKSASTPSLIGRRRTSLNSFSSESVGKSSSAEIRSQPAKPRTMRSSSFATTASVSLDPATVQAINMSPETSKSNAAQAMKEITSRSHPASPLESPVGPPPNEPHLVRNAEPPKMDSRASSDQEAPEYSPARVFSESPSRTSFGMESTSSIAGSEEHRPLSKASTSSSLKRQSIAANAASATAMAKKWGLDLVAKRANASSTSSASHSDSVAESHLGTDVEPADQPIGRGLPLPPPGTPLPGPPKPTSTASWTAALSGLSRRKPVPTSASKTNVNGFGPSKHTTSSPTPPPLPQRPTNPPADIGKNTASEPRPVPTTQPRRKIRTVSVDTTASDMRSQSASTDDVLVIEAPVLSQDSTQSEEDDGDDGFGRRSREFLEDTGEKSARSVPELTPESRVPLPNHQPEIENDGVNKTYESHGD